MFFWVRLTVNVILRNARHNFDRYAITQSSSSSSTWFRYIHLLFLGLELVNCECFIEFSAVTIAETTSIPIDASQRIQQSESWVLSASGRLKSSCSYVFMPFSIALRRYAHILVLCHTSLMETGCIFQRNPLSHFHRAVSLDAGRQCVPSQRCDCTLS
jgi:hypothetical protein